MGWEHDLELWANIASLVGFLISLVTLALVWKVRNYYIWRGTADSYLQQIQESSNNLLRILDVAGDAATVSDQSVSEYLEYLRVDVTAICRRRGFKMRVECVKLSWKIWAYRRKPGNAERLRSIYNGSLGIRRALENELKEAEWNN